MIALLYLLLTFLAGRFIVKRLIGRPEALFGSFGLSAGASAVLGPWFSFAAAVDIGLLATVVFTYALAVLAQAVLPESVYPLLPANAIIGLLIGGLLFLEWRQSSAQGRFMAVREQGEWRTRIDSLRIHRYFWLSAACFTAFAAWIAFYSFNQTGSTVSAGASVFSDFAPHTALVSSFAKGRNFPTSYPHFANDGIAYHFLFYFLCGNLHYLGLPIDLAINLPSILVFVTFCILLGALAVSVTHSKAAFLLAPGLLFFRSSLAFLTRLRDLWLQTDTRLATVLEQLLNAHVFIGDTPRDDWGLWGLNVYANQRHLLLGFGALLIVFFLFYPLMNPVARLKTGASDALSSVLHQDSLASWLPRSDDRNRLLAVLIIVILLPYFHGSALVALLVILSGMALFSRARLAHAVVCLAAVVSSVAQGWLFRSGGSFIDPQIHIGFIAENRSLAGILAYLFEMSGLVLPLALIAVLLVPSHGRLLFIFSLPLLFGLMVSLTPDVTVNHKFLIMTFGLCGCLVSGLLIRIWKRKGRLQVLRRLLAVTLLVFLTMTGLMELVIFNNINQIRAEVQIDTPLTLFVEASTPPRSVLITAPYHYHALLFTGRQIYFGHAYYAWSAGHDTWTRELLLRQFLAAPDEDLAAAEAFISAEKVDYLLIDDELRRHPEFSVNEAFFRAHFRQVALFPEMGDLVILDLHQTVSNGLAASG